MSINKKWLAVCGIVIMTIVICGVILVTNTFGIGSGKNGEINEPTMINTTILATNLSLNIQTLIRNITITAPVPESRTSFPYYKAYYAKGDVDEKYFGELEQERNNLTPAESAPYIARKAMEPYGGIPSDAYVAYSVINKAYIGGLKNPKKVIPFHNQLLFYRTIDGIPVVGMNDGIGVWLGDNGQLLAYTKHWRTLGYLGTIPIVPVDKAIQKLGKGEIINSPQSSEDAVVTSITLRYYASSWNKKEIYLEPVWDFYAIMPSGNPYEFFVYARQFASFTETPVIDKGALTVTFSDTSDASPTRWLWDFGDGTTSTEQDPTHTYEVSGTYTVTLTVWNDLGSDTTTQQYTVGPLV